MRLLVMTELGTEHRVGGGGVGIMENFLSDI